MLYIEHFTLKTSKISLSGTQDLQGEMNLNIKFDQNRLTGDLQYILHDVALVGFFLPQMMMSKATDSPEL